MKQTHELVDERVYVHTDEWTIEQTDEGTSGRTSLSAYWRINERTNRRMN